MRLYAYRDRHDCDRFGVLVDGRLLTGRRLEEDGGLEWGASHMGLGFLLATRRRGLGDVERAARKAVRRGAPTLDLESRRPAAAVGNPWTGKIVCVGLNYGDHAREGGRATPDRPMLFSKFANAIVGDGEAVVRPEGTRALDLEVELGIVIGAPARRVTPERALDHVAGYVVVNDVSARDWQGNPQALREGEKGDGQWLRAKGSDTFLPVGPDFVTADELDPRDGLAVRSWRIPASGDGDATPVLMQDGNTADMLYDVPALVSFVSRYVTLEPGDLIATGTPAGVGVFRDPPVFLEPGDRVRCAIEGIGMVENPIVDWTEDPRPAP
jgi:2-keto-4-pentenoate hydratase/2-oxohepta-3-ene-1,7-dioic acid hydratase in catechol pathway